MYTVESRVGRLIEARFASPLTHAEMEQAMRRAQALVFASPGRIVSCTDVTGLEMVPPTAVDLLVGLFTRDAPKVERAALLLPGSKSTVAIQMEHTIRRAGIPNRMTFQDVAPLQRWLGEVLTPPEQTRLTQFLKAARVTPHSGQRA
jgi:hypothetical protein